ncbi:MAG: inverse autotransporter beta domain-containing protein, partial [Rouxiella aceris]|nr:inverse autotransporter beta domain-containing protein [Rouxiella aceris]
MPPANAVSLDDEIVHEYKLKAGETVSQAIARQHQDLDAVWQINNFLWINKAAFLDAKPGSVIYLSGKSPDLEGRATSSPAQERERFLAQQFSGLGQTLGGNNATNRQEAFDNYALGLAGSAVSQQAENWLGRSGTARVTLGLDSNKGVRDGAADFLLPLYDNKGDTLVFTQMGARRKDSVNTLNLGMGTRYFSGQWMYGANVFYDDDITGSNRRWGLGGELWTDNLKLSANGYWRLSDWHQSGTLEDYDERPANGYDLRADMSLPSLPQLGAQIKYERYLGDSVALFGPDDRQKNPQALTFGVKYTPIPLVTLGADYRIGEHGQSDQQVSVQFTYDFGRPLSAQLDPAEVGASRSLMANRYALVERNNDVILNYRKQTLVRLSLPATIQGSSGQVLNMGVNVTAKHAPAVVQWQAAELLSAGGSITGSGSNWQVQLPPYQLGGSNIYPVTGIARDTQGNESSPATTQIIVNGQGLSALNSKVSYDPGGLLANGKATTQLTIVLRDENNQAVTGKAGDIKLAFGFTPSVNATEGDQSAVMTSGPISEVTPGTYQSTLTAGTRVGTVIVTPSVGSTALSAVEIPLSANADAPVISAITVIRDYQMANGVATAEVAVTVTDPKGNPLQGQTVLFTANNGTADAVSFGPQTETDAQGHTQVTLTSTQAGVFTIMASATFAEPRTVPVTFIPESATAKVSSLVIAAGNNAPANGATPVSLLATVTDALGNPLPGQTVEVVPIGDNSGDVQATVLSTSDNQGRVAINLTSRVAGNYTVAARVGNTIAQAATATFVADRTSAHVATLTVETGNGAMADGKTPVILQAIVKDQDGNPIAGQQVNVLARGVNASYLMIPAPALTNAQGETLISVTSPKSGDFTLDAQVASTPAVSANLTFTPDTASARVVSITSDVGTRALPADDYTHATLTVLVKDNNGNPVPNRLVKFEAIGDNGDNAHLGDVLPTDNNGQTTVEISSQHAGNYTIAAHLDQTLAQVTTVIFHADESTAHVATLTLRADNIMAPDSATLDVTVLDSQGNAVPGQQVQFSGASALTFDSAPDTDLTGKTSVQVRNTAGKAGNYYVSAVTGLTKPVQSAINFIANNKQPKIANLAVLSGFGAPADGITPTTFEVTVEDVYGNPLNNVSLTLRHIPEVTLNTETVTTNEEGKAQFTAVSKKAASSMVTATITDAGITIGAPIRFSYLPSAVLKAPASLTMTYDADPGKSTVTTRDEITGGNNDGLLSVNSSSPAVIATLVGHRVKLTATRVPSAPVTITVSQAATANMLAPADARFTVTVNKAAGFNVTATSRAIAGTPVQMDVPAMFGGEVTYKLTDAGTTNAHLDGNKLTAPLPGTATVTATESREGYQVGTTVITVTVSKKAAQPLKAPTNVTMTYDADLNRSVALSDAITGGNGGTLVVISSNPSVAATLTADNRVKLQAVDRPTSPVTVVVTQLATADTEAPKDVTFTVTVNKAAGFSVTGAYPAIAGTPVQLKVPAMFGGEVTYALTDAGTT